MALRTNGGVEQGTMGIGVDQSPLVIHAIPAGFKVHADGSR